MSKKSEESPNKPPAAEPKIAPKRITKANIEGKVMEIRYRKAWEIENKKLSPENQAKVKYAKEHPEETLVDPVVGKFVRAVIELAESDKRI